MQIPFLYFCLSGLCNILPLLIFKSLQSCKSKNLAELHSSVDHSVVIEGEQFVGNKTKSESHNKC